MSISAYCTVPAACWLSHWYTKIGIISWNLFLFLLLTESQTRKCQSRSHEGKGQKSNSFVTNIFWCYIIMKARNPCFKKTLSCFKFTVRFTFFKKCHNLNVWIKLYKQHYIFCIDLFHVNQNTCMPWHEFSPNIGRWSLILLRLVRSVVVGSHGPRE